MKVHRTDRGAVTLAVLAPVLAAVIGGAAAVGAAVQIINMAPSDSPVSSQQSTTQVVQYGDH
jgi:hypothetical protein